MWLFLFWLRWNWKSILHKGRLEIKVRIVTAAKQPNEKIESFRNFTTWPKRIMTIISISVFFSLFLSLHLSSRTLWLCDAQHALPAYRSTCAVWKPQEHNYRCAQHTMHQWTVARRKTPNKCCTETNAVVNSQVIKMFFFYIYIVYFVVFFFVGSHLSKWYKNWRESRVS